MGAGGKLIAGGAAVLVLYAVAHDGKASADSHHNRTQVAAAAISYARAQLGKPYCWGGTGASCPNPPYTGYDCSGLMYKAYAAAGVRIPRTSQKQWAGLRHVPADQAKPGDLVLAPGADGTWASPGHVGMLLPHGRVLQAYATGYPIAITSLSNFAANAGGIVGYARPGGAR